jgi:hypothetical protein
VVVAVLTAVAALLVLAPAAAAASAVTADIRGLEYAATPTEGRFGGTADGAVAGGWLATVVHDPLRRAEAVPITGGSFILHSGRRVISGTFVSGSVTPLNTPSNCGNERFDVTGTLALRGGGRGSFAVVLTHLRTPSRSGCVGYGATVAGSLRVPSRAAAS